MNETQMERVGKKLVLRANPAAPGQKARAARKGAAAKRTAIDAAPAAQKIALLIEYIDALEARVAALEAKKG